MQNPASISPNWSSIPSLFPKGGDGIAFERSKDRLCLFTLDNSGPKSINELVLLRSFSGLDWFGVIMSCTIRIAFSRESKFTALLCRLARTLRTLSIHDLINRHHDFAHATRPTARSRNHSQSHGKKQTIDRKQRLIQHKNTSTQHHKTMGRHLPSTHIFAHAQMWTIYGANNKTNSDKQQATIINSRQLPSVKSALTVQQRQRAQQDKKELLAEPQAPNRVRPQASNPDKKANKTELQTRQHGQPTKI